MYCLTLSLVITVVARFVGGVPVTIERYASVVAILAVATAVERLWRARAAS
jgi:hypothetical protein